MKAKPTLSNIKGYLQAHYRQVLNEFDYLEPHIKEQAEFRLWRVKEKSPECYKNDSCIGCGCQVSSKIYEDRACSENWCYGEMLSKEGWELFKQKHPTYKKFLNRDVLESDPMIIRDLSKEETLADLMQNNPDLTKEELLYWCPEFKNDLPGIKGTKFKIKLSKDNKE